MTNQGHCKSLLRYPGGKSRKRLQLLELLKPHLQDAHDFVEPYVGGGSVTLMVASIYPGIRLHINDKDPNIFAFWDLAVNGREDEIEEVSDLLHRGATIEIFDAERMRCYDDDRSRALKAYHAIFFSKVTHNGIFWASPIGGRKQEGKTWKIDCLYNVERMMETFRKIRNLLIGRTEVSGMDALDLIVHVHRDMPMYLDPPYFVAGKKCYSTWMTEKEHFALASELRERCAWVLSYDDCPEIRSLYGPWANIDTMDCRYSMASHGDYEPGKKWADTKELIIMPKPLPFDMTPPMMVPAIVTLDQNNLFQWTPTEDVLIHATIFADKTFEARKKLYEDTNQNKEKTHTDFFVGKVGEWAVYFYLRSLDCKVEPPEGYVPGKTDFNRDLSYFNGDAENKLHVKTQTLRSERKWGRTAWIFQAGSDKNRRDPILDMEKCTPQDFFAGCTFDELNMMVYVRAWVPVDFLHENKLFTNDGVVPDQRGWKLLVWLVDINRNRK